MCLDGKVSRCGEGRPIWWPGDSAGPSSAAIPPPKLLAGDHMRPNDAVKHAGQVRGAWDYAIRKTGAKLRLN
jgi:hypothetical protein